MNQFNIIDGLRETLRKEGVNEVVLRLSRNPLAWEFLSEKENFQHIRHALGEDADRWTVANILDSTANLDRENGVFIDFSLPTIQGSATSLSFASLSAGAIWLEDQLQVRKLDELVDEIAKGLKLEHQLLSWAMIFSKVFQDLHQPVEFFLAFSDGENDVKVMLLAQILAVDDEVENNFRNNLKKITSFDNLETFSKVIKFLSLKGEDRLIKRLIKQYFYNFNGGYLESDPKKLSLKELFNFAEINHHNIYLSQYAENEEISDRFKEKGKQFAEEYLKRSGVFPIVSELFNGFGETTTDEKEGSKRPIGLIDKVQRARNIQNSDPKSLRSLSVEIYEELLRILDGGFIFPMIDWQIQKEATQLLISCNLIRESAILIDRFLKKNPSKVELLEVGADLHHKHGNHAKAINLFKLLEIIRPLSRQEKVSYAESLSYCEEWGQAYGVRKSINFVDLDDVKKTVYLGFKAGQYTEIVKTIEDNPLDIVHWPICDLLLSDFEQKRDIIQEREIGVRDIWLQLSTAEDKAFFIDILERKGLSSTALELLINSFNHHPYYSILTQMLIEKYLAQNYLESVREVISKIGVRKDISQKNLEKCLNYLVEFGFEKISAKICSEFSAKWLLSTNKNIIHAKIALDEGNFEQAKDFLAYEVADQFDNEEILTLFALAQLSVKPKTFPLGLEDTHLNHLDLIKNKFKEKNFKSTILSIIAIELSEGNKIESFKEEIQIAEQSNPHEIWRLEAALANEYFKNGQFDLAIQHYKEVERIMPFYPALLKRLFESYLRLKLIEEAEVIFQRLIAVDEIKSAELVQLASEINLPDEWIIFIEQEYKKFPTSKEIILLFALVSLRKENYSMVKELTVQWLSQSSLDTSDYLIAAQLMIAVGERNYAEQILNIAFANSKELLPQHYLTAALICYEMGELDKAIVMVNHLQPFDSKLTALKLELLLDLGRTDEAITILKESSSPIKPIEQWYTKLPLINPSRWQMLTKNESYFYQVASNIYLSNGDYNAALSILKDGLGIEPDNEHLCFLFLEVAKLANKQEEINKILDEYEARDPGLWLMCCALGEAALLIGDEVRAAKYLSNCLQENGNHQRVMALRAMMLKRNGNSLEAKEVYQNAIQDSSEPNVLINYSMAALENKFWLAQCAYELENYQSAIEICRDEIHRIGLMPGFINVYLSSLSAILRQNVIYQGVNAISHVYKIRDEDINLIERIEEEFNAFSEAIINKISLLVCKAYIHQNSKDLQSLLDLGQEAVLSADRIFANVRLKGVDWLKKDLISNDNKHEDLVLLAIFLYQDYPEGSLELIKEFVTMSSTNPIHLALLAQIYNRMGNYTDAYSAINLALSIWPKEYGWELFASEISHQMGKFTDAAEHLNQAKSLSNSLVIGGESGNMDLLKESENASIFIKNKGGDEPNNYDLQIKAAQQYIQKNRPGKAAKCYETAQKIKPLEVEPLLGLSKISQDLGNLKKAMKYVEDGLRINDADIQLIIQKTKLLKILEGNEKAIVYLNEQAEKHEAIRYDLQIAEADLIFEIYGLYECLSFLESLPHEPDCLPEIVNTKSKYYLMAGDIKRARSLIEETLTSFPNHAEANALAGEVCRSQGDLDQAVDYYLRAIKIDPRNEKYYLGLFSIYNDRRDTKNGVITLEKGYTANPESVLIAKELSKNYYTRGMLEEAREIIDQALKIGPKDEEAVELEKLIKHKMIELAEYQKMVAEQCG